MQISSIEFNPLKHHLDYIRNFLKENKNNTPANIVRKLKIIGHSATDVYLGRLKVNEILSEISDYLNAHNLFNKNNFFEWVFNNSLKYRIISISDGSNWTLRFGNNPAKFIHLHPARNQPMVLRLKANTLKSALLFLTVGNGLRNKNYSDKIMNNLREIYLALPPLKSLNESSRLEYLIKLLTEFNTNE